MIDGRTIDVKRAVPRDRAPLPRLVRVTETIFLDGWVGWGFGENLVLRI